MTTIARIALGLFLILGAAGGCGWLQNKPSQTVNVSSSTTQPVVKQNNGTFAVEVDGPKVEIAQHPHLEGVHSVDNNRTVLNFNFNSGWVSNVIIGGLGLIGLILVVHAYKTKQS